MTFIGLIIAGVIIGVLARLFMPGRQPIGVLITVILGILGVLIGWWLAGVLGVQTTNGIDWIRWIISIVVAAVLITIYIAMTGRRKTV
ncbi:MAG TPA: GlsB/YeaQ/YmgE family stress response membrane protein [Pedococcus sp.]|nr:GlsB/YeaQ/YmgE family stress response membrane protein [Pedococcus sp.]